MRNADQATTGRPSGERSAAPRTNPFLGWSRVCRGVDQRGDHVRMVYAERRRGRVRCTAVGAAGLPAGGDRAPVIACLSPRESMTRRLEAPFSSRRKAASVFPTLLDIQIPFAIEACLYTFLDCRRTAAGVTRTLAVAAMEDTVERKLQALDALGLSPFVLDQEGLAVWSQFLREHPGADPGPRAVLVLEGEHSSLTIGMGPEFLSGHAVRADDFQRMERLVRGQCGAGTGCRWFLAGAGAADAVGVARVRDAFAAAGETVSVIDEPEWFVARALATRGLLAGPLRCNLRSGRFTHPRVAGQARWLEYKVAVVCLLCGLLLCGTNAAVQWGIARRDARLSAALRGRVDSLAQYPVDAKGADALRVAADHVAERTRALKPFSRSFAPSLVETLAGIVSTGQQLGLNVDTLSLSRQQVVISGVAREWATCDRLGDMLKAAGYRINITRKESLEDESIPFTISSEGGS